jgi:hypothetical protein
MKRARVETLEPVIVSLSYKAKNKRIKKWRLEEIFSRLFSSPEFILTSASLHLCGGQWRREDETHHEPDQNAY